MTKKIQNKKFVKMIAFAMVVATIFAFSAFSFSAGAEATIANKVIDVCQSIGSVMTTILSPVCAVCLGICLISLIFGKNSKTADSSIQWIKRIVICFVLFNCIGLFLEYGVGLMNDVSSKNHWNTLA